MKKIHICKKNGKSEKINRTKFFIEIKNLKNFKKLCSLLMCMVFVVTSYPIHSVKVMADTVEILDDKSNVETSAEMEEESDMETEIELETEEELPTVVNLQPENASVFHDTDGDGFGEFEGWGTSLCWWANRIGYSDTMTNKAAEVFFSEKGLNLNIGRYNIGGGDCVGEVAKVAVNDKAQFYDAETDEEILNYDGLRMSVNKAVSLADMTYMRSDADFGITVGTKVGEFKYINYINQLGAETGDGGSLYCNVNVEEAGEYTIKFLLVHNNDSVRDMAVCVNNEKDYVIDNASLQNNKMVMVKEKEGQTLFRATLSKVVLDAGDNTLEIGGNTGWGLDFVKMAVIKPGEEGVLAQDEYMHQPHIRRSDSVVPGYATDVTRIDISKMTIDEYKAKYARVDEACGYAWNYNWDADKNQMNVLRAAAKASGEEFLAEAFSNSPPYFMTNSGCSSGGTNANMDNLRPDSYKAFAAYMADVMVHWIEEGVIDFQSVSPMNEPDTSYWSAYSNKQEGCHLDAGTSQSAVITALAKELENKKNQTTKEHVKTVLEKMILAGTDETSIDQAINNYNKLSEEAKAAVTRIDTHTYSGSKREKLCTLAEKEKKNLWMSEVDGDFTAGTDAGEMAAPLGLAQRIITDLKGLKASAWIFWDIIDMHVDDNPDRDGGFDKDSIEALLGENGARLNRGYWGVAIGDHVNQDVVLTKKYYGFGQFTRYIRPGSCIIGTDSDNTLAAYDPKKKQVVIVAINTEAEDVSYQIDLKNFNTIGNSVQVIRSSGSVAEGENWADVTVKAGIAVDVAEKNFTADLKANSITTFVLNDVKYGEEQEETEPTIPINPGTITHYYLFKDEAGNPLEGVPCRLMNLDGEIWVRSGKDGIAMSSPPIVPDLTGYITLQEETGYDEERKMTVYMYVLKKTEAPTTAVTEPTNSDSTSPVTKPTVAEPSEKEGILIQPSKITLYKGGKSAIAIKTSDAWKKKITSISYKSLNTKYVKVNKKGMVSGKKKGTVKVQVKIKLSTGDTITKYCKVTVKNPYLKVSGPKTVRVGEKITLQVKKYGIKGTVKWNVKNKNYAKIEKNKKGKVIIKALKKGSVKVIAQVGKIKKVKQIKIK